MSELSETTLPKISVIIPTYNRMTYVCTAIDSVLAQTYKDYEIIVVDDGSKEDIKGLLSKYGDKIRYIYQENKGLSGARNTGIRNMKGEWAAFLDDDDIWYPSKLQIQMDYIKENPEIDMVSTKADVIDMQGNKLNKVKPMSEVELHFEGLLEGNHVVIPSALVKKSSLEHYGGFDEQLRCCEDYEIWLRMTAQNAKIAYIDQALIQYRMTDGQLSQQSLKMRLAGVYTFNKIRGLCLKEQKDPISNKLAKEYYLLAKVQYSKKMFKDALRSIVKAIFTKPLVGRCFFHDNDSIVTKGIKIIKPYFVTIYYTLLTILNINKR